MKVLKIGFVGTRTWGYSEGLTVDLSRRLDSGHATGSIELYTSTVDEWETSMVTVAAATATSPPLTPRPFA